MNATLRAAAVLMLSALSGCVLPRPVAAPATNPATALPPDQLIALVQADTARIGQTQDSVERTRLLARATATARQCVAQAPMNGACQYEWAQVLGLTARERPVQAPALLKDMLASLKQADTLDAALDHAGPSRLTAVVLLRAPGWPLGPGDPDAALGAAQRAVARDPAYPPNLITLAQAQAKTAAPAQARASYEKARLAVSAWVGATPDAADRSAWQRDIEQGLHDLQ